jgi:hypothetical protein
VVLVRNHLLCPYSDCVAHERSNTARIKAVIDEKRNVSLFKSKSTIASKRTRLPYLFKKWIKQANCPFCTRSIEVVIDETRQGRNVHLRQK